MTVRDRQAGCGTPPLDCPTSSGTDEQTAPVDVTLRRANGPIWRDSEAECAGRAGMRCAHGCSPSAFDRPQQAAQPVTALR